MTSKIAPAKAYVWIWLPGATEPVVAGQLEQAGFSYGRSYLNRNDAISIYEPELPLRAGEIPLQAGLVMPNCIRDASPDAWGRRVLLYRLLGRKGADAATEDLSELTYLLESGSDRTGALDFQLSATEYVERGRGNASLDELLLSAERVEKGLPLTPELDKALMHGSSIGGARPKALIDTNETKYIAKFSTANDLYNMVKTEFVAMRLARLAGLNTASVELRHVLGKDVLLVERFDRRKIAEGWVRRSMVSALTLLELDEMQARHASYEDLAEQVRHRFLHPKETLRELFGRMVFNVLCGNTDDHARNHAAFWDGESLSLTPAYDIAPPPRTGGEAGQAMFLHGHDRMSRIAVCLQAAGNFLLDKASALDIVARQVQMIAANWKAVCDEAGMTEADRRYLWRRQFLNPFAFYGAPEEIRAGWVE